MIFNGDQPMSTNATSDIRHPASTAARVGAALVSLALAVAAAVTGYSISGSTDIRAAAEAEIARAIEKENEAFCSRFGVGPETTRFAECVAGLKTVRDREIERRTDPFI
jgi:hypothetical protein